MIVWIFQTGEPLQSDFLNSRPMRAIALSNALLKQNIKVIVWSSTFFHQNKTHRAKKFTCIKINPNFEIRLIPSIGYKKNIGFRRILDHFQLALNLKKILSKEKNIPNVAFIGYPPIEFAFVASSWLKKRNIPYLVDVKDQWPEIFVRPFPVFLRSIIKLIFYPYYFLGRSVILNATSVSSITKPFLSWACSFSNRKLTKIDKVFPLSSIYSFNNHAPNIDTIKFWSKLGVKKDKLTRFYFIGTFSNVFDFKSIQKAAEISKNNHLNFQFVLCGNGEKFNEVQGHFGHLNNVIFPGWINHSQMIYLAKISHGALAPYLNHSDFLMSIPNKVTDYLSFGSPIISPLKGEVKKIITKHHVGFFYNEFDENSLFNALKKIHENKRNQKIISHNARKLYSKNYNGEKIYDNLINHLKNISNS